MKFKIVRSKLRPCCIALADENGVLLPNQISCDLKTSPTEPGELTVTFLVDGDRISIAAEQGK